MSKEIDKIGEKHMNKKSLKDSYEYKHLILPIDDEYTIGNIKGSQNIEHDDDDNDNEKRTENTKEIMLRIDNELNEVYYKKEKDGNLEIASEEEINEFFLNFDEPIEYVEEGCEDFNENVTKFILKNEEELNKIKEVFAKQEEEASKVEEDRKNIFIQDFDLSNFIDVDAYEKEEKRFISKLVEAYDTIKDSFQDLSICNILHLLDGGFCIKDLDINRAALLENVLCYDNDALNEEENDLIHELIHLFSDNEFAIGFYSKDEYGRAINEGFTEYYAQSIVNDKYFYDIYTASARTLQLLNDKDYVSAFFNSNIDELYENDIPTNKLNVLFEALDKKMYFDAMDVPNNIGFFAKTYLCDIMFEKLQKDIINQNSNDSQKIMLIMDETRDILACERIGDEMGDYQEFENMFDRMYLNKYKETMKLYIDIKNEKEQENKQENEQQNGQENNKIYLGKFECNEMQYEIYVVDGKIRYYYNIEGEKLEVSKIMYNKFDEAFGTSSEITYDFDSLMKECKKIEFLSMNKINFDELADKIKVNEEDKDEVKIKKSIKDALHFYNNNYEDVNAINIYNKLENLNIDSSYADLRYVAIYSAEKNRLCVNKELLFDENQVPNEDHFNFLIRHEVGHIISCNIDEKSNKKFTDKYAKEEDTDTKGAIGFYVDEIQRGINEGFTDYYALKDCDESMKRYIFNYNIAELITKISKNDLMKEYSSGDYKALYEGISNKEELFRLNIMLDLYTNLKYHISEKEDKDGMFYDYNDYKLCEKAEIKNSNFVSEIELSMLNVITSQFQKEIEEDTFELDNGKEVLKSFDKLIVGEENILDVVDYSYEEVDIEELSNSYDVCKNFIDDTLETCQNDEIIEIEEENEA